MCRSDSGSSQSGTGGSVYKTGSVSYTHLQRLEAAKAQLDNLHQQQAAAKEEVGKPFLYEEELRSKNARLVELDTLLNIDGKGQACLLYTSRKILILPFVHGTAISRVNTLLSAI